MAFSCIGACGNGLQFCWVLLNPSSDSTMQSVTSMFCKAECRTAHDKYGDSGLRVVISDVTILKKIWSACASESAAAGKKCSA